MANTIKLKRSSVAGNEPTSSQIEIGEVALNMADSKLWFRAPDDGGAVIKSIENGTKYAEGASAPSSPTNGDLWLDTDDDILYQRQDGAWIQVSTGSMPLTPSITDNGDANAITIDSSENVALSAGLSLKGITETEVVKSASFTPDLAVGTIFSCTGTMTITMPSVANGKGFTIIHATATSITWAGTINWSGGSAPTAGSAIDIYAFISDGTNWYGMQAGTGFA
jgi:hypothetical protein